MPGRLAVCALGFAILSAVVRMAMTRLEPDFAVQKYTYAGRDFPRELPMAASKRAWGVEMLVEDSMHYQMSGDEAGAEWTTVFPPSGPILHFGAHGERAFTISMFHELHCLNVIRRAMVAKEGGEDEPRRCMNYVRQMVMCRADLTLENVRGQWGGHDVDQTAKHVCRDWTAVYDEVERLNQR